MSLQISYNSMVANKALMWLILLYILALVGCQPAQVRAQEEKEKELAVGEIFGAKEFRLHCATCHGLEGKGNGPMAQSLRTPLPNLTTLTKRHNGRFPVSYVYKVIDGREMLPAHGTHEMPIWGERYAEEFTRSDIAEHLIRDRIFQLIYYILYIQGTDS
jgi:mono/diheme cytochrome c family protein